MNPMPAIYLVTGNPNKLKELQAVFPKSASLKQAELDIDEIQSDDLEHIVTDKLEKAFKALGKPVIVEDVSAELACLNGLPGPFIKYFEKHLGKGALWQLAEHVKDHSATIRCTMGYYDGTIKHIVSGIVTGHVVSPRGKIGWGFDFVFVPDGHSRTSAEMGPEEKNKISHRALAARQMQAILFPEE